MDMEYHGIIFVDIIFIVKVKGNFDTTKGNLSKKIRSIAFHSISVLKNIYIT